MNARIYLTIEGNFIRHEVELDNLIAFMEVRGHQFVKLNDNNRQREELQGQPKFAGINGPMWDGDAIRYESVEAYASFSQ